MMKILVVNIPAAEEHSEIGRFFKSTFVPLLLRNFDLVRQKDTEVTFRFSRWGMDGLEAAYYSYIEHLSTRKVFHAAAHAEEEGFDAVMIACFGDPMLWEIRQALNIPVVSIGESSMLLATVMGYKFGVVTVSPLYIIGQEHLIAKYGFKDRSVGVRAISETGDEQVMASQDARHTIECFKKVARELIADGAEVIIPGCALMSQSLRLAPGVENDYPNGLVEVDGVPIADVIGDTIKMAETLVALKRAGSCWISRKGLYAQPTSRALHEGHKVLEDDRLSFWDC
jgi:allantoin racemase